MKNESLKDRFFNQKYATSNDAIQRLEGQLLGLVDMLGLPDSQREATKAAVRQYVWGLDKVFLPKEVEGKLEHITITSIPVESIKSSKELGQDE